MTHIASVGSMNGTIVSRLRIDIAALETEAYNIWEKEEFLS
jgi:hypothetical protein